MRDDPLAAPVLRTEDLAVGRDGRTIAVLEDTVLGEGEAALLLGPSGSGKSTALFTLAGLLAPVGGAVRLDGEAVGDPASSAGSRLRGRRIGMVFQDMHLLSGLSVLDNLLLAPFAVGVRPDRRAALRRLAELGLGPLALRRAETLSRGEAQRAAIARAMLLEPRLILADEPTASLDDANAARVASVLLDAARTTGAALVVATHDQRLKALIPGRLTLRPTHREAVA